MSHVYRKICKVAPRGLYSTEYRTLLKQIGTRSFFTSSVLDGRKSRDPYDKRFGLHYLDAGPDKPGGSKELQEKLMRERVGMPQQPGVYTRDGKFHFVPEMIPEFVVPDLKGFKLKPYVSYKVPDVKQSEFTAKDLFNSTYAKTLLEQYKSGKIDIDTFEKKIQDMKS